MKIKNKFYSMELSDTDGRILSFCDAAGEELIYKASTGSLFRLYLLDEQNKRFCLDGTGAEFSVNRENGKIVLNYAKIGGRELSVQVIVRYDKTALTRWRFSLKNGESCLIYKVDFPEVIVPNDLGSGAEGAKLFWPITEGVVIDDVEIREHCGLRYNGSDFPATGWEGRYPGACQMQFMAYYRANSGLYLAAHDAECNVKKIDFRKQEGGLRLEFGYYLGTDDTSDFESNYDMVLGVFRGDWYDAAEIYRQWLETTDIIRIPKLKEETDLPDWWEKSPIVVVYPVRGEGADSKEITTSEYYPYTKATEYIKRLHEEFDAPMMPLLCHWEGTAPWAPPYVWPPYGDKDNFNEYVAQLHRNGDYIGIYCSGIAWTQYSGIDKNYNREKDFEENHLEEIMQVDADQILRPAMICGLPIKYGYDMCPACEKTKQIAVGELEKIVSESDVDYVQFFDQNLGGATYPCYSVRHGHPRCPGKWQNDAMKEIFARMRGVMKKYGKQDKVLIGCEADAAECFINDLRFNDSRHNIGYFIGTPVSAYNFLFHEYVNNFMGNQNTSWVITDFAKYPDNLFYRFAHSFSQGDMLTVVLKDKGKIHWDWCTPWDVVEVDQGQIKKFIRHLNDWRKYFGHDSLTFGRMAKPNEVVCGRYKEEIYYHGMHDYPSVVTNKYIGTDGKSVQFLINYLGEPQEIGIRLPDDGYEWIADCRGVQRQRVKTENGLCVYTLPARTCVAVHQL